MYVHSAIVWGASAKHARGQKVGLDHILEDEDGRLSPFFFATNMVLSLLGFSRTHCQEVDTSCAL